MRTLIATWRLGWLRRFNPGWLRRCDPGRRLLSAVVPVIAVVPVSVVPVPSGPGVTADPTRYGLSETASWEVNRDALQRANDEVAAAGGGRVAVPAGSYRVKGVVQDARVEFHGPAARLVHPDGQDTDMISARVGSAIGVVAAGSTELALNAPASVEVGSVLGVQGAAGISGLQFTTLAAAISEGQLGGIVLGDPAGFASEGYLVVDSEIIQYSGLAGNDLGAVVRGALGTAAAAHGAGARIGVAMRLVAEVVAVLGSMVTLDRPAVLGVGPAQVSIGILYPKITGLRFDGAKTPRGSTSSVNPIRWDLVRFGRFEVSVENAESAVFLARGTRDCFGTVVGHDCSVPDGRKGACVWLFQQCHRNQLAVSVSGDVWAGVYLDNRTSLGSEWDGPCDDNSGTVSVVADRHQPFITNTGLLIVGSSRNTFRLATVGVRTGLVISSEDQVHAADGSVPRARDNFVDLQIQDGFQPWLVNSAGNTLTGT